MTFTLLEFMGLLVLTAAVGYSAGWFSGRGSLVREFVGLLLECGPEAIEKRLVALRNDLTARKVRQGTRPHQRESLE